jgi:hypothetical protein
MWAKPVGFDPFCDTGAVDDPTRITGFLPYTSFSTRVPDLAATVGAVRTTDAAALHALDRT